MTAPPLDPPVERAVVEHAPIGHSVGHPVGHAVEKVLPFELPELPHLRVLLRHAVPNLVEATLVPSAIFYVFLRVFGVWPALIAALSWAYGALARRLLTGRRVSGLLILAVLGLTVRTAIALGSGSTFVYFLQPIIATCTVGAVFLGSAVVGRPMVDRLAKDFCPLPESIACRVRVRRLFRHLTLLWGGVNLTNAAVTFWLFSTRSLDVFVATKTLTAIVITWTGVLVTIGWSLRIARLEGIHVPRVRRPTVQPASETVETVETGATA